jgi:hypothetical protein
MLLCLLRFFFPITVAENSQSLLSVLVQQKMAITGQLLCCVRMLPVPPKQPVILWENMGSPSQQFYCGKACKTPGQGFYCGSNKASHSKES